MHPYIQTKYKRNWEYRVARSSWVVQWNEVSFNKRFFERSRFGRWIVTSGGPIVAEDGIVDAWVI